MGGNTVIINYAQNVPWGKMYNITVLCSGGIDSSVLLSLLYIQGISCSPIFIDYGQITSPREYQAAKSICDHLGLNLERLNIPDISRFTINQLTNPSLSQNSYYPNRNLLLLTVGSIYAYQNKHDGISLGAIMANDTYSYPDIAPKFLKKAEQLINFSLNYNLALIVPLVNMSKNEVVSLGRQLKVPLNLTYSCLTRNDYHCGLCDSCISRKSSLGEL